MSYEVPFEIVCDSRDRDKWLNARREGIGGSDAPAILGLTSWASPASIQADKWGLSEEAEEAEVVRWGRRLEDVIRAGLAADEGWTVGRYGLLLRSKERPWQLCTPDACRDDKVFVQIKNTMKADAWGDRVPEPVWVQCQHELSVTGDARCIAAALIFGNRLRWSYVERDDKFIAQLIAVEEEFWRLTQAGEPAAADGSEHTKRAYQLLWPEDKGTTVALPGRFTDLDMEREALAKTLKSAKDRIEEIDNEFRLAIKDATYGALQNGVKYSYMTVNRAGYTVEPTTFRQLRRNKGKKK